jgi:hypothetical protein
MGFYPNPKRYPSKVLALPDVFARIWLHNMLAYFSRPSSFLKITHIEVPDAGDDRKL